MEQRFAERGFRRGARAARDSLTRWQEAGGFAHLTTAVFAAYQQPIETATQTSLRVISCDRPAFHFLTVLCLFDHSGRVVF
jgi:hypothetical protein